MLKNLFCKKTMSHHTDFPIFQKGRLYKYRHPTEKEFENDPCAYIFFDDLNKKIPMQYDQVKEYF